MHCARLPRVSLQAVTSCPRGGDHDVAGVPLIVRVDRCAAMDVQLRWSTRLRAPSFDHEEVFQTRSHAPIELPAESITHGHPHVAALVDPLAFQVSVNVYV